VNFIKTVKRPKVFNALVFVLGASHCFAQDVPDHSKMSFDQIAKELANPNTSLGFMALPVDYIAYTGDLPKADSQSAYKVSFQPSIPYLCVQ
jgi:hypothetical protein